MCREHDYFAGSGIIGSGTPRCRYLECMQLRAQLIYRIIYLLETYPGVLTPWSMIRYEENIRSWKCWSILACEGLDMVSETMKVSFDDISEKPECLHFMVWRRAKVISTDYRYRRMVIS
jgi:hypothetical protein